jgi:hypothetical protein
VTNFLVIPETALHTGSVCYRKFQRYISGRLRFPWYQNNTHSIYSVGSFAAEIMIVYAGEKNHKNYVLLLRKFSWIYRSVNFARSGDFKFNDFIYYINTLLRFFLYKIMVMAMTIFTCIVALRSVKLSFKNSNVPLKLVCFNTYSSTVIQTVCTLVDLSVSFYVLDWPCHFRNSIICNFLSFLLPPWGWPLEWPKLVGCYCI